MKTLLINNKSNILNRAFTLIELLVVISIIGILAALVTVSFSSAQKQAKDSARKSDLVQYRTALESFANKNNGLYPTASVNAVPTTIRLTNLCTTLGLTNCPDDSNTTLYYKYRAEGGNPLYSAKSKWYILWAQLENISPTTFWVVCSNGSSGKTTTEPSAATACPTLSL